MAEKQEDPNHVILPARTASPFVSAFGITLICAGLVIHPALSVVGLVVALAGAANHRLSPSRRGWPPRAYSGRDSSLFVGHQGRYRRRGRDGDGRVCLWFHRLSQYLVPD